MKKLLPRILMLFRVTAVAATTLVHAGKAQEPSLTAEPPPPSAVSATSTTSATPESTKSSTNSAAGQQSGELVPHAIPEIHATISIPKDWNLAQGSLLDGGVLLATKEKITGENDPWSTGLSMSIDRNGAKDSDQKASDYALSIARGAAEKAGEEASPLKESQDGAFHQIRFDFPVQGDQSLLVTEELRANDSTGTVTVILWQMPKEDAATLSPLRDSILSKLKLDSNQ